MTVDTYTHYQLYYDTVQGTIVKLLYSSDMDPDLLIQHYPSPVPYITYIWHHAEQQWIRTCCFDGWLAHSCMRLCPMSRLEFLVVTGHNP